MELHHSTKFKLINLFLDKYLVGFSTGTEELLARLDRLMAGLPAEDEFMALAVWMEKCKLIHKVDQEQFPISSSDVYQVPDLLAVFDCDGQEVPVLIEVKATRKDILPNAKLRLSKHAYEKLSNYSKLVGLPLLIAWKVSGYWTLFDIREMQKHEAAYHIDGAGAMSADLMFSLLGNILITPMPGVSFTFILKDLGPTGRKAKSIEKHLAKFHSMRLLNANGEPITKMSWPQFILWVFSDHKQEQNRQGDLIEISFIVPEEPSWLPAYALLPLALFQMAPEDKRPKSWYDIIKCNNYGPISYSQFKKATDDGMGTFVQYVLNVVPHRRPDFLPVSQSGEETGVTNRA